MSRSSLLPDVPTTIEAGYPNSNYEIWLGMLMPALVPRDIVNRLNAETIKALQTPAVRDKLARSGLDPLIMSPDAFGARIKDELSDNAAIAKTLALKIQLIGNFNRGE